MNKLILTLCFALLTLVSCSDNLFGSPGGSGKSDCKQDAECWRIEAEELFRKAEYEKSYKAYEKITQIDSKRSVGWFGMAKAGMWRWRVTPFNITSMSKDFKDLEPLEMIQKLEIIERNRYLQGAKNAYRALDTLNRRDSLTELWLDAGKVPPTGSEEEEFPMSDMEYRIKNLSFSFLLSKTLYDVLGSPVFDAFGYGCIYDSRPSDYIAYGCDSYPSMSKSYMLDFDDNGNFMLDLEAFKDLLKSEEDLEGAVVQINEILDNLENNLNELIDFISIFSDDSNDEDELQKQIEDFKGYALFYQLNRGVDNDGDGCIDEELIFNEKVYDVDGDELQGENARILFFPPSPPAPSPWECINIPGTVPNECIMRNVPRYSDANGNPVIHNMKSNDDDWFIMTITGNAEGAIDTIIRVSWSLEENGFIRGPSYDNKEIRKEVQTEKDKNGRTVCWSLADRQNEIGGCWHNYDADKFRKYRDNPIQREKGSMNPECYRHY
ncbi:MAG: hypothetical protein FWH22_10470 [Fibromonadales bacterium]|nr:hypothetical protein [Fibromonadales bacterium]